MTITEHIEQTSFAYDLQFPPDVAEGLPLSAALRSHRRVEEPPVKRAIHSCMRIAYSVSRKK